MTEEEMFLRGIECASTITFMQTRYLIAEVCAVGLAWFVIWYWQHYFFAPLFDGVNRWGFGWLIGRPPR